MADPLTDPAEAEPPTDAHYLDVAQQLLGDSFGLVDKASYLAACRLHQPTDDDIRGTLRALMMQAALARAVRVQQAWPDDLCRRKCDRCSNFVSYGAVFDHGLMLCYGCLQAHLLATGQPEQPHHRG